MFFLFYFMFIAIKVKRTVCIFAFSLVAIFVLHFVIRVLEETGHNKKFFRVGRFCEISHFDKHFVKNTRKKGPAARHF